MKLKKYSRNLAMIPQNYGVHSHWYGHWCYLGGHYEFISGERRQDASFRATVAEAVADTLVLSPQDLLVSNMAQLNLEFCDVLPPEDEPQHVVVAFFMVHLYRRPARLSVEQNPDGRWLSNAELLAGMTDDGLPVSPRLTALLRRADLLRLG